MKKTKKILLLIFAVTMLCGINTSYADARDEGTCDHYAENFNEKLHTIEGEVETVNCSWGYSHPCYVMGKLETCQIHYYTNRTPYSCRNCKNFLYYKYTYEMCHQYQHD